MTTRLQEKRMAFEAKRGNEGRAENSPYEDVKAKLGKWLHVSDPEAVEIILATAVATYLKGDPLWVLLVGPSGGGKTEILNMFTDAEDVMVLSKMTSHTLMSGLSTVKEGEDLIYQLDGKLLVIKDLAPILEMGRDEQKEVLSDLRDAFDGLVVRAWGSGKPRTEWREQYELLLRAATDSIPTRRSAVLAALLQGKCSQADIKEATSIPLSTVKHELEDLRVKGGGKVDHVGVSTA